MAAGKAFHPSCFGCKSCNVRLSSTTLTEKAGEIYCNNCYAREFGPKGFRGGVPGTSMVTGNTIADEKKSEGGAGVGGFCSNCGTKRGDGRFCGSCGNAYATASAANSQPASGANTPKSPPSPRATGIIPTVKVGASSTTSVLGGPAINQGCGK
jgi:hypothetical protein